jgi:hypothetical protein
MISLQSQGRQLHASEFRRLAEVVAHPVARGMAGESLNSRKRSPRAEPRSVRESKIERSPGVQ